MPFQASCAPQTHPPADAPLFYCALGGLLHVPPYGVRLRFSHDVRAWFTTVRLHAAAVTGIGGYRQIMDNTKV